MTSKRNVEGRLDNLEEDKDRSGAARLREAYGLPPDASFGEVWAAMADDERTPEKSELPEGDVDPNAPDVDYAKVWAGGLE